MQKKSCFAPIARLKPGASTVPTAAGFAKFIGLTNEAQHRQESESAMGRLKAIQETSRRMRSPDSPKYHGHPTMAFSQCRN